MKHTQLSEKQLGERQAIFAILEQHNCGMTAEQKAHLFKISETKFGIFEECITGLRDAKLLNAQSFNTVYNRQLFHIGKVKPSTVTKLPGREYSVMRLNGGPRLFALKQLPQITNGYFASVTEGYGKKPRGEDVEPDWAVKTLHQKLKRENKSLSLADRLKSAKREVRCNRLLQRQAYFFQSGEDVSMALEWRNGQTLYALTKSMHTFPFSRRLRWLITLLEDICNLHQQFIAHKDLHSNNVVVDTELNKASLIDFGKAEKTGPGWGEMASDLAMLGAIVDDLFLPEVSGLQQPYATAIQRLYSALVDFKAKCTSQQALDYCRMLNDSLEQLSDAKIDEIARITLDRSDLRVNDVLCGSSRPIAARK